MSDIEQAKKLFFEALAFIEASDFQSAEFRLRQARQFSPGSVSVLTNLAVVLLQQNKLGDARACAENVIATNENNIEALLVLANCHFKDGKLPEALAVYDKIIILDPKIAETYNNRGIILQKFGRLEAALDSYGRAIALESDFTDAHIN